jgi:protein gp37
MADNSFFDEQSEQSLVKSTIIAKYFDVWASVIISTQKKFPGSEPAVIRFLSLEPLLSPLPNIDLSCIDWVIVGGESGSGARLMKKDWVIDICQECRIEKVPFFFKQWGGINKKKAGRLLDGKTYGEMPKNMLVAVESHI